MKILRHILVCVLIGAILAGCTNTNEDVTIELSDSQVGETYQMKSDFVNKKTITLYFPDLNSENLLRIVKEVNIYQGASEVTAIVNRLLSSTTTEEDNYIPLFNGKVKLAWIKVSRNLATVNLEGEFEKISEKDIFCGVVSLVNTMCELNSIDYVEVLFNGQQFKSRGLLVNPMSTMDSSLHLLYLDHDNIINSDERRMTREKSILYFLDQNENFLIAEISNVAVGKESAAEDLFKLLKNEPYYGSGIQSCIPQNVIMPTSAVTSQENEEYVLTIRLEAPKYETMDNKTRYMMCGGLTLTLLSYFEDINAVRILINGEPALEETYLYKDMFFGNIGQIVSVYLPNRDLDYLFEIDFAMSQNRYNSPKERLNEIILADTDYKANTAKIIPQDVQEEDILSVFVHDLCCVVNISNKLYTLLSALPYSSRKMFIYSITNTLTEFENISSVQFLVEGKVVEKLGDDIYIETPILNNPGLVYD